MKLKNRFVELGIVRRTSLRVRLPLLFGVRREGLLGGLGGLRSCHVDDGDGSMMAVSMD